MAHLYRMEAQEHPEWCWAAVCQSVSRFFFDTLTSQCDIAKIAFNKSESCKGLDVAANLGAALSALGVLREPKNGALPFEEIHDEIIGKSLPVCARIGWHGQNRGHFVVVSGCPVTASGEQWVDIADPFYGYSTMPYDQFVNSYLHAGEWTNTFLVQEPTKKAPVTNASATNGATAKTTPPKVTPPKGPNIIWWPTLLQQKNAFEASIKKLAQIRHMTKPNVLPNPLPIYHLGVRDFVRNANSDMEGKLVGWRYYAVGDDPDDVIAGDVDLSSPPRVTRLSSGPVVRKALAAQQEDALNVSNKNQTNYEPRLLRAPGLLAEMFWLKSLSRPQPGTDTGWVVPYHTFVKKFDAKGAHSMQAFKDHLTNAAVGELGKIDPPRPTNNQAN